MVEYIYRQIFFCLTVPKPKMRPVDLVITVLVTKSSLHIVQVTNSLFSKSVVAKEMARGHQKSPSVLKQ